MNKPEMRSCLKLIKPYVPGKPVEEVERELGLKNVIKLASNENPLGPSQAAVEAMQKMLGNMHIYPDGNCYYLREALAEKLSVRPEELIFGNGSDEILSFLTMVYLSPGDEAVMVDPSFSEYDFAVRIMGGIPKRVSLEGDEFSYNTDRILETVNDKTKLVFICSPNNPTGSVIKKADLDKLIRSLPEKVMVVLDQAYIEYVDDPEHPAGLNYIDEGLPVVALRTFSKIYGLAGLRIGYGVAPVEIISELNRVREPFNVSAIAQAAALAALKDDQQIERSREMVFSARRQIAEGLAKFGLKPVPDQANFCFVDIGIDSRQAFSALMQKGVIVRSGDIFGFPTYIRVTYGTPEENKHFITALGEVLHQLR
jgi:histidinol-phosphate aminotransferase